MRASLLLRAGLLSLLVTTPIALAAGCGDSDPAPGPKDLDEAGVIGPALESFKATVRRTTAGVPHVKADDLGGLGYGYGYVFAEDNLCILLEEIVTVRGERAKYFGDQPYDLGNTRSRSNVSSDAVYRMLATKEVIEKSRASLDEEMQRMIRGYAAGVSRYVRELKEGKHEGRHAACRDEPWVREITDEDLYLRFYKLALLGSAGTLIDAIAAAQPKAAHVAPPPPDPAKAMREGLERIAPGLIAHLRGEIGSNMYAFGSEVTGGGGIQFGNPHFPWFGGERLYQVHLTVPGKLDIQGASLYGVPVVLIGFTDTFAWSHTVSTAYRFTPYALTLKPGDQFTYIQDGEEKPITALDFEIEVKGEATPRTVRLYKSEYGPMVYLGNSLFDWTFERAFTIRDANAENFRLVRHYARWNMAKSLDEFVQIQAEEVAVPWVNTTAADKDGNVYYADVTVVPNVPDELAKSCEVFLLSSSIAQVAPGLPLLDGSKKACDWKVDPEAPQPGIFPASQLPKVRRKDWVVNCNDSYWLTNTKEPLTGFPAIVGRENYAQSLRSRLCHQQVLDRIEGKDGLPGTTFTADAVKEIVLSSRVYSAEKFKTDELMDALCASDTIQLTKDPLESTPLSAPVDVPTAEACTVLKAWDNRGNPDSKGSVLWDEFWFRVDKLLSNGTLKYKVRFSAAEPLETPADLDTAISELYQAFAAAIRAVQQAGYPLDVARSEVSWAAGKGGDGDRIPIPGGFQRSGYFTIAQVPDPVLKPGVGYGPITYGNSYIQVVAFGPGGVDASTFVTYGLSTDPASPHFDDYTRLYSTKQWVKAAFTEAEVAADTKSTLELEQ